MFTKEDIVEKFNDYLDQKEYGRDPVNLYKPVYHIMKMGGKRIRPFLLLCSYQLFKDDIDSAMEAALGLEVFHNFTLVHDDIMDDAPIRRGINTVHNEFGTNAAILSGDVMMLLVYRYFSQYDSRHFHELIQHFTETAIKICEGQQMDMEFETKHDVHIGEYLKMIEYKTAVLLGEAMFMGALLADSDVDARNHLLNFGLNMGIAFQLQDDLLDCFGNSGSVGKKTGGDILQGKKTYLFLKTRELLSKEERTMIDQIMANFNIAEEEKIASVLKYYKNVNVKEYAIQLIEAYTTLAISHLEALNLNKPGIEMLKSFAKSLMNRSY